MALRMVAGDSPRTWRRETAREPTGSPVSTYSVMTARRTWRLRWSNSDSAMACATRLQEFSSHFTARLARHGPAVSRLASFEPFHRSPRPARHGPAVSRLASFEPFHRSPRHARHGPAVSRLARLEKLDKEGVGEKEAGLGEAHAVRVL